MAFVRLMSGLVAATDDGAVLRERGDGRPDEEQVPSIAMADLVDSFIGTDVAETTAALHVIAALTADDLLSARIRRVLPSRRQPVPTLLRDLARVGVRAATFMGDQLGDGDNVILSVVWPDGPELTVVVYIDHAIGTRVKDVMLVDEPTAEVLQAYRELIAAEGLDSGLEPMPLADAWATLEHAMASGEQVDIPWAEDGDWPASRPLVEMLTRSLPSGGSRYGGTAAYPPVEPAAVV